jgi:hypothetical protein
MSDDSFEFKKEVEIKVEAELEFKVDVDVEVKKEVKVDVDIEQKVELKGNVAIFAIDVEALGYDTFVELNLAVLTTDEMSQITAVGEAATG